MVNFKATLDSRVFKKFLVSIRKKLGNSNKMLRIAYATAGFRDIIEHFRKEQGPAGKWRRRSQFTQELYLAINKGAAEPPEGIPRRAFNPRNKILQLTGNMRQSIEDKKVQNSGRNAITIISNVSYSGKHDEGLEGLPRRKFMWLSSRAMNSMGKIVLARVVG